MSIHVSKNMIKTSRNELANKYDEISKARFYYDSIFRDIEDKVKKQIYKLKDAIYKCEKEISKAKKVRDENQSTKWQLETKRSQIISAIGKAEWEVKNLKYPTKPRSTDNPEVDKANREAYEQQCDQVDEQKERLWDMIEKLQRQRDDIDELLQIIESNDKRLQEIIHIQGIQISNINTKISNIENKLKDVANHINEFKRQVSGFINSFTSIFNKVDQAYKYLENAVKEFDKANITIHDNEVIDITEVSMVISKLKELKRSISNAFVTSDQLSKKFIIANNNLKDNNMAEAKGVINDINRKCEEAIDVLKRLDDIVTSAMESLSSYENVF